MHRALVKRLARDLRAPPRPVPRPLLVAGRPAFLREPGPGFAARLRTLEPAGRPGPLAREALTFLAARPRAVLAFAARARVARRPAVLARGFAPLAAFAPLAPLPAGLALSRRSIATVTSSIGAIPSTVLSWPVPA